jgi:hypothetical protein
MRFSRLVAFSFALYLCACAHEAENTGSENSSLMTTTTQAYALQIKPPAVDQNSPIAPGRVSRFQRHVIIPGGPDGEMTPLAKNFDGIMDHLEALMGDQIRENNVIASEQATEYSRLFPGRTLE